jgi:hypothetical protein
MSMNKPGIEQNQGRGGDIAARALGTLSGRGDHSCHPRSGRHRYSVDRNAGSRDSGWLALSHQRNRRLNHHLRDGQSAGFLMVARLGESLELRPVSCSCCGH